MNITVVCDVLGSETNGTTVAATNLIKFLQSQNHNVKILCADKEKKGMAGYYVVSNINFGPFNKIVEKNHVSLAKPDDKIINDALKGTDHVHIMLPFSLGKRTMKIAKEKGISVTAGFHAQAENLSCHVRMQNVEFINKAIYKIFWRSFYRYVDAIHYPTKFMRDIFEKSIKHDTNGYVISNGVNEHIQKKEVEKPKDLKNKFVILSTGRYSVEKSQETLIKAIKYSKYKENIQLILAGQGPLENKFKKLARKLPVQPIFKLFKRDEMTDVINYCDLYVHPAHIELEGIACLEAICCGKMTIVSDSKKSATKNFAIDENCIFKNKNPKNLAKLIDFWIENPKKREIYEEIYLKRSKEYNQLECMKKMENMIFEVYKKNNTNKK